MIAPLQDQKKNGTLGEIVQAISEAAFRGCRLIVYKIEIREKNGEGSAWTLAE